jgi:short-subunit dehydrogenase
MTTTQSIEKKPLAVVTGASSGIGYALAAQFAEHGYDLLIASNSDAIGRAAASLGKYGCNVESVRTDLATPEGVEELCGRIRKNAYPVECLAINAGVGVSGDFTRETDLKAEMNMINLNVTGAVHLAKRLLPEMVRRGSGRVLFTSSIAALMPAPFAAVYGATKAFLLSFSEALRNELKGTGVTVTALLPGATETNFFHRAGMEDTKVGGSRKDDPDDVAREGFEALMEGEDIVIAGSAKTKAIGLAARILPETVKAEQHRQMNEPSPARRAGRTAS